MFSHKYNTVPRRANMISYVNSRFVPSEWIASADYQFSKHRQVPRAEQCTPALFLLLYKSFRVQPEKTLIKYLTFVSPLKTDKILKKLKRVQLEKTSENT